MTDFILTVNLEASIGNGEDSHLVHEDPAFKTFTLGVFDGLGGRSAGFDGLTGGQIASRTASKIVQEFLQQFNGYLSEDVSKNIQSLVCNSLKQQASSKMPKSRLIGTLAGKRLCTTVALARVHQIEEDSRRVDLVWMGDSRIYFLSPTKGLQQITSDDLEVRKDAFEMIREDPPMSKFLTADSPNEWHINYAFDKIDESGCILACTDGCFQYLPTPWDFEKLLLKTLSISTSVADWETLLHQKYEQIKGDDISLVLYTLNFEDFQNIRESYQARLQYLELSSDGCNGSFEEALKFWSVYRPTYEARLKVPVVETYDSVKRQAEEKVIADSLSQNQSDVVEASRDIKQVQQANHQSSKAQKLEVSLPEFPSVSTTEDRFGQNEKRRALDVANKISSLLQEARKYQSLSNMQKAYQLYEQVIALDPNNVEANFNLGVLYLNQGSTDIAISYLKKSLGQSDQNYYARSCLFLAKAYCKINSHQEAVLYFKKLDPKYLQEDDLEKYADSLFRASVFKDAVSVCEIIKTKNPRNYYSHYLIGRIRHLDNHLNEAERYLNWSKTLCTKEFERTRYPNVYHDLQEISHDYQIVRQKLETGTHYYGGI